MRTNKPRLFIYDRTNESDKREPIGNDFYCTFDAKTYFTMYNIRYKHSIKILYYNSDYKRKKIFEVYYDNPKDIKESSSWYKAYRLSYPEICGEVEAPYKESYIGITSYGDMEYYAYGDNLKHVKKFELPIHFIKRKYTYMERIKRYIGRTITEWASI